MASKTLPPDRKGETLRIGRRNAALLRGDDDVREWDDEELLRGQSRDRNGHFRGRKPRIVPRHVHEELVRRRLAEAQHQLAYNLPRAIEIYVELMDGEDVDDAVRLRAADKVIERVMGKVPEKIAMTVQQAPWEALMDELEDTSANIIEAEAIDATPEG